MKFRIIITVFFVFSMFVACETYPDWDEGIEYSDVFPISGEWYVVDYDENGDTLEDTKPYILYIYNKSYNPTKDSMWIDNRVGHPGGGTSDDYEFRYKVKVKANMSDLTFNNNNVGDVAGGEVNPTSKSNRIFIYESKVFRYATGIEDATPDSISFIINMTDSTGSVIGTIRTSGHRKTGWEEPNYDDEM